MPGGRVCFIRERTWRTIAASAALQLYAGAFYYGSDLQPATFHVSKDLVTSGLNVLGVTAFVLVVGDVTDRWFEFGVALCIVLLLYGLAESQDGQPAILSAMTLLGLPLLAVALKRTIDSANETARQHQADQEVINFLDSRVQVCNTVN